MLKQFLTMTGIALLAVSPIMQARADDGKATSGAVCQPKKPSDVDRVVYARGGIKNRDNSKNLKVVCPIERDNFEDGSEDTAFKALFLAIDNPRGLAIRCRVIVRNLFTGSVLDTFTETITTQGSELCQIDAVPAYTIAESTATVECTLPPKAGIRALLWFEETPTDNEFF